MQSPTPAPLTASGTLRSQSVIALPATTDGPRKSALPMSRDVNGHSAATSDSDGGTVAAAAELDRRELIADAICAVERMEVCRPMR